MSETKQLIESLLGFITLVLPLAASLHAILRRRDPRAASWWVLLVWVVPVLGPFLYYFFGINRIERKAVRLRRQVSPPRSGNSALASSLAEKESPLPHLSKLVEGVVKRPLSSGNKITALQNGEEAYPAMIKAIDEAQSTIGLSTYIFNHDSVGEQFIKALARAQKRGVQVRVIIDDVGSGFAWKSVYKSCVQENIPVAYFLPTFAPWRMSYMNLRNHRKILTIDGKFGFTGGMNIHQGHLIETAVRNKTQDLHFKIEGPVVTQMQEALAFDWYFTTGEKLIGERWFPSPIASCGSVLARGIADGPDEDFERTKWTFLSALSNATKSIRIVTPYLIPDQALISALNLAAMSGVLVDVVLPRRNDMKLVQWATQAMAWQVLERGVRVWQTPPPFDHTKLMVVDGLWTFFGSTNWDARSLRLNFEFNMECYDAALALDLEKRIDEKISHAHQLTLAEVDSRPFPVKLRDGCARLFAPIL